MKTNYENHHFLNSRLQLFKTARHKISVFSNNSWVDIMMIFEVGFVLCFIKLSATKRFCHTNCNKLTSETKTRQNRNRNLKFEWVFSNFANRQTLIVRAKARVIISLRCLFSRKTSDFDQSLQIVNACDYLRLCCWQFSSHFSGSSHSTCCSSLALQVNCALSVWQKLNKIFVISYVLNIRLF